MRKGGLHKGPGRNRRSGIRGRGKTSGNGMRRTGKRRLERKEADHEIIRQSLGREIVKRIVKSSIGLLKLGDKILWKCRSLPKRKR
jgi:hypothetical protein